MDNNHDIRAAMLGDHEAAKRLTEKGVLLGCPFCGNKHPERGYTWIYCPKCKCYGPPKGSYEEARLAWNTRAEIGGDDEHSV